MADAPHIPGEPVPRQGESRDERLDPESPLNAATSSAVPREIVQEPVIPPSFPRWSIWDVLAVLGFTVLAIVVCSVITLLVARNIPGYRNAPLTVVASNPAVIVGSQFAAYPLVILVMAMLVRSRSQEGFGRAIRWNWPGNSAVAFFVLGVVLAFSVEGMARFLPIPKSLPLDKFFNTATSAYLMAAFGITLAPLLEELFFRGMLYPLMRRWFGVILAVVVTAATFAAIHGAQLGYAWAPILSIFVVGVVLTLTRERTNSVAASFLTHCGYNFTLFTLLWLASDHYRHIEKVSG